MVAHRKKEGQIMHVTHHASRSLLLTLCLLCCIGLVACDSTATNPDTQAQASPTAIPMATLFPTDTPRPLTLDQQIQMVTLAVVQAMDLRGTHATVEVDKGAVTESELLNDCCARVDDIHLECLNLMKATWQDSMSSHIKRVEIRLDGNLVDQYGRTSIGAVGRCTLTRDTEQKFVWDNLDQDSAWEVYD